MFTVKIINSERFEDKKDEVKSIYLREWDEVEVWLPASNTYKDKIESLKQEAYNDYHNDLNGETKIGEEIELLMESASAYKAFVTYIDGDGSDSFYCIGGLEEVYITDSNGNTVYSIR